MAIAVQDLYKPISDFFITKFGTASDDVIFRFDQFGSVISDDDFIDERHPEAGPLPELAQERFSDLVNRVPIDSGDGMHIILSQASIDEVYNFQLLRPAEPQSPALADTFNAIKAEATKVWDQLTLQSLGGLMMDYKPSLASPEDWYDSRSNESWTQQSFDIQSSPTPPATPVWQLRLSDVQIVKSLDLPPAARAPGPGLVQHLRDVKLARSVARPGLMAAIRPEVAGLGAAAAAHPADETALHHAVLSNAASLQIRKRLAINEAIGRVAPKAEASTSRVTVSFEYCLVQIRRPWLLSAFINNPSWCLPGIAPGSLSKPGNAAGLSWLPVAFAAVRNLRIEASWSGEDSANASQASGFGPFRVEMDSGTQNLVHPGLQVAGWVLHRLPSLPPAPVDGPEPDAAQSYVVRAGDTLGSIAKHFYGDSAAWPRIQKANHIDNPDLIRVGDRLTIPPATN